MPRGLHPRASVRRSDALRCTGWAPGFGHQSGAVNELRVVAADENFGNQTCQQPLYKAQVILSMITDC